MINKNNSFHLLIFKKILVAQNKSKVSYEYGLPNNYKRKIKFDFSWHFTGEWSTCTKSCGKGFYLIRITKNIKILMFFHLPKRVQNDAG